MVAPDAQRVADGPRLTTGDGPADLGNWYLVIVGGVAMAELVRRSLRMNPSRVIVGEVLGDEIVTMLNAMSQGNDGSLSTINANSSIDVFNRISTYALQSSESLPVEASHMLIAGSINFVVFLRKRNDYASGGSLVRCIESIREVTGIDGRVLSSEVFALAPDGRAVVTALGDAWTTWLTEQLADWAVQTDHTEPAELDELVRAASEVGADAAVSKLDMTTMLLPAVHRLLRRALRPKQVSGKFSLPPSILTVEQRKRGSTGT